MSKKNKQKVGRNEAHMRYVQEARRSSSAGFHGRDKKAENRHRRKKMKVTLRQESWIHSDDSKRLAFRQVFFLCLFFIWLKI